MDQMVCPRCGRMVESTKHGTPKAHQLQGLGPCLEKARCHVCGEVAYVTEAGKLRGHHAWDAQAGRVDTCPGVGQPVK